MYFVVKLLCDASETHLVWIVIDFDIDDDDVMGMVMMTTWACSDINCMRCSVNEWVLQSENFSMEPGNIVHSVDLLSHPILRELLYCHTLYWYFFLVNVALLSQFIVVLLAAVSTYRVLRTL